MKIRSLLLGSVAAAGLSTGAFAADLGVLTSLDVCDALGLSGLTISSDTNCLQITGGVKYEFNWGDYETATPLVVTGAGTFNIPAPGGAPGAELDWSSKVEAWIKFVATADSDFGPAKAVIKIKEEQKTVIVDETYVSGPGGGVVFDEAYVSIGDSTVIMAGKKGTIMNKGDDVPLNFLGLFNSEKVDAGVNWDVSLPDGGHVIQIVSDLGNGVSVGAGLENLNDIVPASAGTAVGVISYAGDGIAAHLTVAAGGVLDGTIENWGLHAGFSGTFDIVKFVAAVAADSSGYWNGLASASATFDMFTIAVSAEAVQNNATSGGGNVGLDYGFGGSVSAAVTDGVTINLGGRWYRDAGGANDAYQVAAQLVAAVTETVTLTGEVGLYGNTAGPLSVYYGAAQVAWAPGGGFTSSLKGEVYSNGAYKATFKAAKTFE
ncbi:MAG: hypothetical protein Q8L54_13250 [Devosia sp.]|nr:hypothetical protein [Devosia sp.]